MLAFKSFHVIELENIHTQKSAGTQRERSVDLKLPCTVE